MTIKSVLASAFLVLTLAAASMVVAMRGTAKPPMRGFTLYITQTSYPSDGAPIQTATKIRQQKSDGSWKLQTAYANGRVDVGYGEPGRGVFNLDQEIKSSTTYRDLPPGLWPTSTGAHNPVLSAKR